MHRGNRTNLQEQNHTGPWVFGLSTEYMPSLVNKLVVAFFSGSGSDYFC